VKKSNFNFIHNDWFYASIFAGLFVATLASVSPTIMNEFRNIASVIYDGAYIVISAL